jgi:hypothetical protein
MNGFAVDTQPNVPASVNLWVPTTSIVTANTTANANTNRLKCNYIGVLQPLPTLVISVTITKSISLLDTPALSSAVIARETEHSIVSTNSVITSGRNTE